MLTGEASKRLRCRRKSSDESKSSSGFVSDRMHVVILDRRTFNTKDPTTECKHVLWLTRCTVLNLSAGKVKTKQNTMNHTHTRSHAQAQVCTQRAALSQQFSWNEALHPGQNHQMHIWSGSCKNAEYWTGYNRNKYTEIVWLTWVTFNIKNPSQVQISQPEKCLLTALLWLLRLVLPSCKDCSTCSVWVCVFVCASVKLRHQNALKEKLTCWPLPILTGTFTDLDVYFTYTYYRSLNMNNI